MKSHGMVWYDMREGMGEGMRERTYGRQDSLIDMTWRQGDLEHRGTYFDEEREREEGRDVSEG